jgi:hypothetical protein
VISSGPDAFVQVQMPPVAGWVSGNVNFGLNVPAVGATLPLQIDGGLVSGPVLGSTSGAAVAAGRVGEEKTSNLATNTSLVNGVLSFANIILTPGVWLVSAYARVDFGSFSTARLSINYVGNAEGDVKQSVIPPAPGDYYTGAFVGTRLVVTSGMTVYANIYTQGKTGSPDLIGASGATGIQAVRIA